MKSFRILFCLFFVVAHNSLNAQNSFVNDIPGNISEESFKISKVQLFKGDTSGITPFNLIDNTAFENLDNNTINLGTNKNDNWLRFTIANRSEHNLFELELAYPILDKVKIYFFSHDSLIQSFETGESYPFSVRPNKYKNFIFPLNLNNNDSVHVLLYVKSGEQIILPLFISTPENTYSKLLSENLFNGIYFGIILVMLLYNLFVFFSIRDNSYLYYVSYIFTVGLVQAVLHGYGFKYLWPDWPALAVRATMLSGALSGITTIYFVRYFLQTKTYSPRFNKMLTIFAVSYFVSIVFCIAGELQISYNLINITAGPGSFILLFTAINIYRKYKSRPALFFIIAWSIFIVSIILFVLKDTGVIPYNSFTISGLQIGSAIEVTLLSFALADKINIFRKEKEESQAEALATAMENERIIREQNITLELKVNERTIELQESNQNLNSALYDLKQAQSQLVDQEKMASLGQLTAGIAHEINNPINFVTSNVKPLRRDVDLLMDLMLKIEAVVTSDSDNQTKSKEIKKLKEEFDFDYLQEEIKFLLKGINEGSSRTAEIVKGLRIFSRVDEDDIKLANIHDGIDSTLIIINNSLENKINIKKEYATDIPNIECYPGKLNQVFLNILSNGIYAIKAKFGEQNGGELLLKTERSGDNIRITLKDNGTGMDEATKQKLFEPFFTTKPVGEGTGLGLSIVFNTIARHNGNIEVESTPGEGTAFIITLPFIHVHQKTDNV